jgi:hypothetical protein
VRFAGEKVDPDEINARYFYQVTYPSIGTAAIWSGVGTGDVAAVGTLANMTMDYPRNLLVTITGVAGGEGGTATIVGKNQFGESITEAVGFATANAGGTAAGTKIFSSVSAATVNVVGLGGTAIGTIGIGYAAGTAAGIVAKLGLPVRVGAASDVKRLTFIKNGAVTAINGGTIGTAATAGYIDTVNHSFMGTQIIAATDMYSLDIVSTFNQENLPNVA